MSDLQDRRSMPEATGAETAPFVIGCTHDDRDWAEWVASHLDGLGYPYQFADPFLPTGPAAIGQVADWRASGVDLVVIASDALLHGVPIDLHLGHHTDRETPLIIVLIEDVELPAEWRDAIQARMFEVPDDYHASRDMLLRALEQARARPFVLDGSAEAVAAMAAARRDPLPAPMIVVDPFPAPEPVIALEAASHAANGATDHAVGEVPAPEPLKPAALSAPLPEALTTAPQVIDLAGEGPALLTPPPTTPAFGTFIGVPPAPPPVSPWGTAPNAPSAWSAPGEPALEQLPAFPPPAAPAPELGTEPDERPAALDAPIIGSVPAPADAVEATEIEPPAEQAVAEPASPWASVEAAITAPPPAPAPPADVAAPPASFASPVGVASSPWSAPVEVTPAAASAAAVDDPAAPTLAAPAAALAPDLPAGAVEPPATAEAAPMAEAPPAATDDDLPAPLERPRSGLLGMGAAAAWSGARRGGASVTETEVPADGEPVPPATPPSWGLLPAGQAAAPAAAAAVETNTDAVETSAETDADADRLVAAIEAPGAPDTAWVDRGDDRGDAATAAGDAVAAADGPGRPEQVGAEAEPDTEVAEPLQPAAAVPAEPAVTAEPDTATEPDTAAEPDIAADSDAGRIVRLPFDEVASLWSIDGALELLAKGLRHRCAEPTPSAAGQFGLTAPLDAPSGVVVALTGPAGVGKTTIALDHAHRQRADLEVLWWLRGGSTETLRADLRALAVAVGVEGIDASELIEHLKHWLATTTDRWLLVIDGLAADVSLHGLLPDQGRGQVVVTARTAPDGFDAVAISSPSAAAARRALYEHMSAVGRELEPFDGEALDRLAATLAEHPWAIAAAAAQLGERGVAPGRLVAQLARPPMVEALAGAAADNPVDALLLVALEGAAERSSVAAEAIVATAALADSALLRIDLDRLGGPRAEVSEIGRTFALLQVGREHAAPIAAVTDAVRRLSDDDAAARAARAALRTVDTALPHVASASVSDLYAPHAAASVAAAARVGVTDPAVARLERAVADWARRLNPTPAPAAGAPTTNGLAAGIDRTGPDGPTGRAGDLAATGAGAALPAPPPPPPAPVAGPDPHDGGLVNAPELVTLRDRSVQAAERGAYHEAIRLLEELVQRSESAYGIDDLRTLSARNDLANALIAAGSQHRAHQLLVRVLDDTTRVYGEQHAATLLAMHNLANSHADLGRHAEALQLREQVLEARERSLGVEHPQTVSARSNLANSLAAVSRADEALQLRELVADVRLRTLGLDSPQTMGALNNLANSYADVGRHDDALRLRQQVLEGRERVLGTDHPHTITARNNLANSLAAVGRYDDARQVRERTLQDCERVLGPDHPHTITARANLAFSVTAPAATGGGAPGYGAVANGASPTTNGVGPAGYSAGYGAIGTLQPVEVDVEAPAAAPPGMGVPPAGSYPVQPGTVPAEPVKKKRRFWFFGRR